MDTPDLSAESLTAGREYMNQVRSLGLHPEVFVWVYDFDREKFLLWLVWSGIDKVGPLAVAELLFKAYRVAALPRSVDPFLLDLRSPKDVMARQLIRSFSNTETEAFQFGRREGELDGTKPTHHVERSWILHLQAKRHPPLSVTKDWRRFNERVSAVAA